MPQCRLSGSGKRILLGINLGAGSSMSEASAAAFVVGRSDWLRAVPRLAARPIADSVCEVVAIAALCPMLLAVAMWNGFPLIFYDTGAYIFQSFADRFVPERSPVFSLFIRLAGAGISLWFVAIVQVILVSFVIVEAARAVAPRMTLSSMLVIGAGLVVLTALPWHAAQIEPDCFTGIVVLALYLLAFHAALLGRGRSLILIAVAALAAASHPSHLGLALGLTSLVATYKVVAVRRELPGRPSANVLLPLASAALGLLLVLAGNYHFTRHLFISRAGGVFTFARMMQDGIAKEVLDESCSQEHFALCRYRNVLPKRADDYLWNPKSPFTSLHRFIGTERESERLVNESLEHHPVLNLEMAVRDAAKQLVIFHTGDGIEPQQWILSRDFRRFMPGQLPAYDLARQQKGSIGFMPINVVHQPVAWLALLGVIGLFAASVKAGEGSTSVLLGFVLAALIGNAIICGVFSGPHARYQSRLIWTPVLVLALVGHNRRLLLQH